MDEFTRILLLPKDNITLLLPGGTRLSAEHGECYIEREALFIHIRNAGFYDVHLSGHLVTPENTVVPAGHSLSIPLFDPELKDEVVNDWSKVTRPEGIRPCSKCHRDIAEDARICPFCNTYVLVLADGSEE